MLRITKLSDTPRQVTLLLEGHIASEWVTELESETRSFLQTRRSVVLDFSGVNFVTPAGAEMLKRLTAEKVRIVNCPAIIKDLLT